MDWVTNRWMAWTQIVTEPHGEGLITDLERLGKNVLKGSFHYEEEFTSFLRCLHSAVEAELSNSSLLSANADLFKRFYQDVVPKMIAFQLSEQSWRWIHPTQIFERYSRKSYYNDEGILLCLALLADLSVMKLRSLQDEFKDGNRLSNTVSVLRTLSEALDRQSLFQRHHEQRDLPPFIQYNPHLFTKTQIRVVEADAEKPGGQKSDGFWVCLKQQNRISAKQPYYINCKCRNCEPPESHRWITILLEYFGNNVVCSINGFRELARVIETVRQPEKVQLEILEAIFSCLLSPRVAERMIEEGQKKMQEQVLASLMSSLQTCAPQGTDDAKPPKGCQDSQPPSYEKPLFEFSSMRISEPGVNRIIKKKCDRPTHKRSHSSVSQPRKVQVCSTSPKVPLRCGIFCTRGAAHDWSFSYAGKAHRRKNMSVSYPQAPPTIVDAYDR
ncbi:hypothetical protein R1flu_002662 [Riccia fluitans]|uniref:Uncharacterized protein n=1 Tax=Riccia fluitans TaxID=41844 RepID=A0ABD1YA45_9MARC